MLTSCCRLKRNTTGHQEETKRRREKSILSSHHQRKENDATKCKCHWRNKYMECGGYTVLTTCYTVNSKTHILSECSHTTGSERLTSVAGRLQLIDSLCYRNFFMLLWKCPLVLSHPPPLFRFIHESCITDQIDSVCTRIYTQHILLSMGLDSLTVLKSSDIHVVWYRIHLISTSCNHVSLLPNVPSNFL